MTNAMKGVEMNLGTLLVLPPPFLRKKKTPTASHTHIPHIHTALTPNPSHRPCVSFSFFAAMRLSSACSLFMKSECKLGCVETDGNHSCSLTQMHIFIKPSQRCNASFKVEIRADCTRDQYVRFRPCGPGLVLFFYRCSRQTDDFRKR